MGLETSYAIFITTYFQQSVKDPFILKNEGVYESVHFEWKMKFGDEFKNTG